MLSTGIPAGGRGPFCSGKNAGQEKVRKHYDTIAEEYDGRYDCSRGRNYHTHLSGYVLAKLPKGGRLLDIGCGTGLFARQYISSGGSAVGIDLSENMIVQARQRCSGCDFSVGTADMLPFRDASFDAVSSILVFTYLSDPEGMFSEAYRVLRPGGSLAICTLGRKLLTRGIPALYQIGEKMRPSHIAMKNFGERYYNEQEMRDFFSSAGFEDIGMRWCSFAHVSMMDPLFSLARKIEPFVERQVPQLTFNLCASARKPAY